jgi:acyl carrier protein
MNRTQLVALLADAIEVSPDVLVPTARIADIHEWNSLAWLAVIATLDEQFGFQLPAKQIRSFKTVEDLLVFVESSQQ